MNTQAPDRREAMASAVMAFAENDREILLRLIDHYWQTPGFETVQDFFFNA